MNLDTKIAVGVAGLYLLLSAVLLPMAEYARALGGGIVVFGIIAVIAYHMRRGPFNGMSILAVAFASGIVLAFPTFPAMGGTQPEIEPFSEIAGVVLGMRASDLLAARPNVEPAAYAGYEETVAGYQVVYHFAGATYFAQESQRPASRAKLVEVWAGKPFESSEEARGMWTAVVAEAARAFEVPTACFSFAPARPRDLPALLATWGRGPDEFRVMVAYGTPPSTASGGRLVLRWIATPRRLVGARVRPATRRVEIECPV